MAIRAGIAAAAVSVRSGVRSTPLTSAYGVLLAGAAVLQYLNPELGARLIDYSSTNLDNLKDHPIRSLLASALFMDSHPAPGLMMGVLPMAWSERWIGSWRTGALFAAGHTGATLITAQTIKYGLSKGYYGAEVRSAQDIGVSYGSLTVRFALIGAAAPGKPRAGVAAGAIGWLLATSPWKAPKDFSGTGHLVAAAMGAAAALPIAHQNLRRVRPAG